MKYALIALAVVCVAAAGAFLLGGGAEPERDRGSELIAAKDLRTRISSRADWFASFPKTTVDGIAMACEMSDSKARRYDRLLGQTFTVETLAAFRSDCNG